MKNDRYFLIKDGNDILVYNLNECVTDQSKIEYYFGETNNFKFYKKNILSFKNGIYYLTRIGTDHKIWATKDDNNIYRQGIDGPILTEVDKELYNLLYKK